VIRIQRGSSPKGFSRRAKRWTDNFHAAREHDPPVTITQFWSRVRPQIRLDAEALYQAFHGKCAFCESRMAHVSAPHIEHYRPKQKFPDLAFEWDNWLLSCGRCNETKWTHFPDCDGQPCLIDPANEDPAQHIEFFGYVPIPLTKRSEETIKLVGLDRSPLEDERSRWLLYINALILLCCVDEFRTEARELLLWCMQDDAPYAAMTRCYLRLRTPRLANPTQPHTPISPQDPIRRIQRLTDEAASMLQNLE